MRLLVLGTGTMAKSQVASFLAIDGVEVVGAVDTDRTRLDEFADHFNIEKRFSTLDEAIAWGEFDAATNVTPDRIHHATSLALIAAGKHVFCEKPLAENYAHALEMTEAAEAAGIFSFLRWTPGLRAQRSSVLTSPSPESRTAPAGE